MNDNQFVFGMAEGYYGRLLTWTERQWLLGEMADVGCNTWLYAPKDDALHRFVWRERYAKPWLTEFSHFCSTARRADIEVVAGVAPGLDYDFSGGRKGADFEQLLDKCEVLRDAGARRICLLMDDIDADFDKHAGSFESEGKAHAWLANSLGDALGESIDFVPRIYADELIHEAVDYLPDCLNALEPSHRFIYCGSDVVSRFLDQAVIAEHLDELAQPGGFAANRLVLWDNLWANDYCPRRLFVGPWFGRDGCRDVLVNPTGLPHTDALLMRMVAAIRAAHRDWLPLDELGPSMVQVTHIWRDVLLDAGVHPYFMVVAEGLWQPWCNGDDAREAGRELPQLPKEAVNAFDDPERWLRLLDDLLWRWKSPLAREWFPWLMGLRQDVLALAGQHSDIRIRKTQPLLLQGNLLNGRVFLR
ncbi:MAG: hypothetical protein CSB44_01590 [Gammaproteobacteria bacterium]|nr:MAG: hypothetical protein CSB44_01590 [Gammaproteobacteria bacterium]